MAKLGERYADSSAYVIKNMARVWPHLDAELLEALKYDIDKHIYYFGQHFTCPVEQPRNEPVTVKKIQQNVQRITEILALFQRTPNWVDLAHTRPDSRPIIVCNAYFSWNAKLQEQGWQVQAPLWVPVPAANQVEAHLRELCQRVQELFRLHFQVLVDEGVARLLTTIRSLLEQYYQHPSIRALAIPYGLPFFECLTTRMFRRMGKPTFLVVHGYPCRPDMFDAGERPIDYYVVWGKWFVEQAKLKGVDPSRVLVSGHPDYGNYQCPTPRFDLQNVLVCTRPVIGAPACNMPIYQNRADILDYVYRVQVVLKSVGVTSARLRPHPSESAAWYRDFVDTKFYTLDSEPLAQSIGRSSLVVGGISTVFLETLLRGVNYAIFEPAADYNPCQYPHLQEFMWPFDGSDPRVPIATTEERLAEILSRRQAVDVSFLSACIDPKFDPTIITRVIESLKKPESVAVQAPTVQSTPTMETESNKRVVQALKNLAQKRAEKEVAAPAPGVRYADSPLKKMESVSETDKSILQSVMPLTMTPPVRLLNTIRAAEHIEKYAIPGSIVECGVWRGGNIIAAMKALIRAGNPKRQAYLYDTFEGMAPPTEKDVCTDGSAAQLLATQPKDKNNHYWAYSPLEDVQRNVAASGYPSEQTHFVKGKVEETIPATLPGPIALLRLDTDWYESTRHELIHLYPLLVSGGVMIIDDYGFWKGSRRAVDEYFGALPPAARPQFFPVDKEGICCIKP